MNCSVVLDNVPFNKMIPLRTIFHKDGKISSVYLGIDIRKQHKYILSRFKEVVKGRIQEN